MIPAGAVQALAVLRQRNFRLVWSSIMFGSLGTQMEQVVLAWFILTLTDSPFLVGFITFARLGANIFALFAGALADRVSRRLLLVVVQFIIAALALALLALVWSGLLEIWHIFAIAFIGGLARVFELPAGQALTADSVSQERISNGVALTSAGMNLTLVLGPLLGGTLFQAFGPAGAYSLIAGSHALGGVCALLVRVEGSTASAQMEPVWTTGSPGNQICPSATGPFCGSANRRSI